jgi:type VI secretion system protein ImpE
MNAKECYEAGRLAEAVQEALNEVKRFPAEIHRRSFLCELLCFAGDLERADKQLDLIAVQDPDAVIGVSLFRQLMRAEQARRDFFAQGRLPEFVDVPTELQKLHLQASIFLREGELARATELLVQAEEQRPPCTGSCDGQPIDDFRDMDDVVASSLEVFTTNGKYYWIPLDRVESIEFHPPKYPRDLIWRAAQMVVRGGPEGEVYLPALYVDSYRNEDERIQLGRATDWVGDENEAVRGVGQRMFLVGDEDRAVLSLQTLEFEAPADDP